MCGVVVNLKRLIGSGISLTLVVLGMVLGKAQAVTPTPTNEMIYFVMLDRFANGDATNDYGSAGSRASVSQSGFKPSDSGYYHGGDIKGLSSKISYIKSLGFTAIWVTPIVRQNTTQGGSAAYHGYWGLGFDQVDSHLGTMQDWKDFVAAAHASGLKVILDIVLNHTGDIIKYGTGNYSYESSSTAPYKSATGVTFNPTTVAGLSTFPSLSATTSFTKKPYVDTSEANVKSPAWLNNVTNYHNRGDSTWTGESVQWGDFYGLDDLFTESPTVVNGWISVYQKWITDTGIDGFRIDTAKHVNEALWSAFLPAMRSAAATVGKTNFPMWGEVYDGNPVNTSYWIKNAGWNEVLDFPFQGKALDFVRKKDASAITSLLNDDDLYTTANTSAKNLGTFLGNHDMGRIGTFLAEQNLSTAATLSQDNLIHALMFGIRGNPIVYYGDEFGLKGGNDKAARQDLFPTSVSSWKTETRIGGTAIGTKSSFETTNPLQATLQSLTSLRKNYPAFATGPQVVRIADSGLLIISRLDPVTNLEYLEVFNTNSTSAISATTTAPTAGASWELLAGAGTVTSNNQITTIKPNAYGYGFFKASKPVLKPNSISVTLNQPTSYSDDQSLIGLSAKVTGCEFNTVEFFVQTSSNGAWQSLGSDDSPTFSNSTSLTNGLYRAMPLKSQFTKGAKLNFKAVVTGVGGVTATSTTLSFTNN
jgi:glycosidase